MSSTTAFYILVSYGGKNYVKHDCNPEEGFCSGDTAWQFLESLDKESDSEYRVESLGSSEK